MWQSKEGHGRRLTYITLSGHLSKRNWQQIFSRWTGEYPPNVLYLKILTWNSPTVSSTANSCSSAAPWQPSQTPPVFCQPEYLKGGSKKHS